MAAKLLEISGVKKSIRLAKEILNSGKAYKKMQEIIKAQGGNPKIHQDQLCLGKYRKIIRAKKSGKIVYINIKTIARIAKIAGAPLDKEAGLFSHIHLNYKVKKGDPLLTIYSKSKSKLKFALAAFSAKDIKIS